MDRAPFTTHAREAARKRKQENRPIRLVNKGKRLQLVKQVSGSEADRHPAVFRGRSFRWHLGTWGRARELSPGETGKPRWPSPPRNCSRSSRSPSPSALRWTPAPRGRTKRLAAFVSPWQKLDRALSYPGIFHPAPIDDVPRFFFRLIRFHGPLSWASRVP